MTSLELNPFNLYPMPAGSRELQMFPPHALRKAFAFVSNRAYIVTPIKEERHPPQCQRK